MITFICLNNDELGFCCGNSYHSGLTNSCPACSFDLWCTTYCLPAIFKITEWKREKVFSSDTCTRWILEASNASFNPSYRIATDSGCWTTLGLFRHIRDSGQVLSRHPCALCHSNSGILSLGGIFSHYI